ncbi:hypothetical protein D9611_010624 [Ephemerocybe angulata]|uniref:Separase n=1 Tax=Ephemerocybe angulata TaxID=980116 RepID=A0A8H5FAW9_9AGAR|nr:hypothetical protein D9611_010624 [Tulosesus angulatus]
MSRPRQPPAPSAASKPQLKPRQPPTTTTTTRRPRAAPTGPDELADALASKLKITSSSSRRPAPPPTTTTTTSPRDVRADSMRAVNAAMQGMSALAQTGWKKSSSDNTTSVWRSRNAEANHLAAASREHLAVLRGIDGATVEIERAALSVVGKLVAMDMHEAARETLKDSRTTLCAALHLHLPPSPSPSNLTFLSLPLPAHPPTDPVHLTMLSTYLIHALTTTCSTLSPSDTTELSQILTSPNSPSILEWLPHFHPLPQKHVDSLLTRAYTAITKTCSARPSPPASKSTSSKPSSKPTSSSSKPTSSSSKPGSASSKPTSSSSKEGGAPDPTRPHHATYALRAYALRCLASASPGTVAPDSFWDQSTRFTASFVKSSAELNEEGEEAYAAALVLRTLEGIVRTAEARPDAGTFMDGTKFFAFCDYWISFAKRIHATLVQTVSQADGVLDGTSSEENALIQALQHCSSILSSSQSQALRPLLLGPQTTAPYKSDPDFLRVAGRVDRALERLRRTSHKLLELPRSSPSLKTSASTLLKTCIDTLRIVLTQKMDVDLRGDVTTRAIDSLFVLGRTTLDISNPGSYIPAYDYLDEALGVLSTTPSISEHRGVEANVRGGSGVGRSAEGLGEGGREGREGGEDEMDVPNYLRCVSGAFYNLAGALYQGSRYGAAVPFLRRACEVGERALEGHKARERARTKSESGIASEVNGGKGKGREGNEKGKENGKGKEKEREREAEWTQLEQQLYRRWELLAVCYLKNGDRKNSYDAFVSCIRVFPFGSVNLAGETDAACLSGLFSSSSSSSGGGSGDASALKPLASLLDRTTYVGACELLLPPSQVSLLHITTSSFPSLPSRVHSAPHTSPTSPPTSSLSPRHKSELDARVLGALLEQQYEALFVHRWKEGARGVLVQLLRDALGVYARAGVSVSAGTDTRMDVDTEVKRGKEKEEGGCAMPVRRARVLLRALEFAYRDTEEPGSFVREIGFETLEELGVEVLRLLAPTTDLNLDVGLGVYKTQYAASAHLWLATCTGLMCSLIGDDCVRKSDPEFPFMGMNLPNGVKKCKKSRKFHFRTSGAVLRRQRSIYKSGRRRLSTRAGSASCWKRRTPGLKINAFHEPWPIVRLCQIWTASTSPGHTPQRDRLSESTAQPQPSILLTGFLSVQSSPFGPIQDTAARPFVCVRLTIGGNPVITSSFKAPAWARRPHVPSQGHFAPLPLAGIRSIAISPTSSMNISKRNSNTADTRNGCALAQRRRYTRLAEDIKYSSWPPRSSSLAGIRSVAVRPMSQFPKDPLPHNLCATTEPFAGANSIAPSSNRSPPSQHRQRHHHTDTLLSGIISVVPSPSVCFDIIRQSLRSTPAAGANSAVGMEAYSGVYAAIDLGLDRPIYAQFRAWERHYVEQVL